MLAVSPQQTEEESKGGEANSQKDAIIDTGAKSKIDEAYEMRVQQPPAYACRFQKKHMLFRTYVDPMNIRPHKPQDRDLYFKFYNNVNIHLIRYTFEDNGFREAKERNQEWSVMWASSNIKSQVYQQMSRY